MQNTNSKNQVQQYGEAVELLHSMQGSFSPYLMLMARLSNAFGANSKLRRNFDREDIQLIGVLQEHFYQLMIIRDATRENKGLDDSELQHARKIISAAI